MHWSYGCHGEPLEPDAHAQWALRQDNKALLQTCCIDRDVCFQSCGIAAEKCASDFIECVQKDCPSQTLRPIESAYCYDEAVAFSVDDLEGKADCKVFHEAQQDSCECVPLEDWERSIERSLVGFYKTHQPDKLDESGEIRNSSSIWEKWRGNEPQLFYALARKYRRKAVQIRKKTDGSPTQEPRRFPQATVPQTPEVDEEELTEEELARLEEEERKKFRKTLKNAMEGKERRSKQVSRKPSEAWLRMKALEAKEMQKEAKEKAQEGEEEEDPDEAYLEREVTKAERRAKLKDRAKQQRRRLVVHVDGRKKKQPEVAERPLGEVEKVHERNQKDGQAKTMKEQKDDLEAKRRVERLAKENIRQRDIAIERMAQEHKETRTEL